MSTMKVLVDKGNYDQIRQAEKAVGKKIKQLKMIVSDCVDGVWGAYQIIRCYKSISKYYAEMKLLERADNEFDADLKVMKVVAQLQKETKRN